MECASGIVDAPRLERCVPVVVPLQLVAELGQATVDDHTVLGEAGSVGPLSADLQTDHVITGAPRAAAPVPCALGGPAPAPHTEPAPGIPRSPADEPAPIADHEGAFSGAGLMLRREVEQLVA